MINNLKSQTAEELLARWFPERTIIIDPWLRGEETCVVWAASGVGKTMFSLSLAVAVAGGGCLGDWSAPEPRKVLYVDGEMNIRDLQERIRLMMHQKSILTSDQATWAGQNLTIIARQDQDDQEFYDVTNTDHQKALIKRVKNDGFELVILDNFTTLSTGLDDENDATAFKQVQELFMELKRAGVATILVHHANKGGRSMRGSTALEATFEVIIGLQRPKVAALDKASFALGFDKFRSRGSESLTPRVWTLRDTGWFLSDDVSEEPKEDPVYKAIKSLNFTSGNEIAKGLGMAKTTVHNRIQKLIGLSALTQSEINDCYQKARDLRHNADTTPFDQADDATEEW